ncbi:hypothetical protein [Ochrobactrum sp. S1502_03]|uniref:hypothetical protein n=1 Tax=Ochrobactrum sp. S1502_03 TaxID=3108451 RepID=UPI0037CAEB58
MTPTIPEAAVQAALDTWLDHEFDGTLNWTRMRNALTASLPFLQGVKVKALKWTKGVVDIAHPHPGMKYVACSTTPKGSWAWWLDNAPETRDVFSSEEAAKAAAQADYEARILSALEPFANSYPQGANLAAHSKNENGPDHEPSPRAQALEEGDLLKRAALIIEGRSTAVNSEFIESLSNRKAWEVAEIIADNDIKLGAEIRALSSQPVEDWECEADYEVICNGDFVAGSSDLADAKHYAAVYAQDGPVEIIEARTYRRPLPASPGVSE